MDEQWRDVVGYEGWYRVSNTGQVKRVKAGRGTRTNYILKNVIGSHGYPMTSLTMNGVSKQYLVHQMVAIAFLGPYPEVRNMINHKDGNKRNSHIENLEYVTHSENCIHSRDVLGNNRQGEKCPTAKLSETQALDILSHWESGLHTYQEIAEKFNTSVPNVCNIVNKHTWTHLPTVTRDTNTPSPGAKLNEYIVKEIRKLHSEGKTYKSLSSIFHVDKSTIAHIIKRRTWKDVD